MRRFGSAGISPIYRDRDVAYNVLMQAPIRSRPRRRLPVLGMAAALAMFVAGNLAGARLVALAGGVACVVFLMLLWRATRAIASQQPSPAADAYRHAHGFTVALLGMVRLAFTLGFLGGPVGLQPASTILPAAVLAATAAPWCVLAWRE
jgi:hypothetical protein